MNRTIVRRLVQLAVLGLVVLGVVVFVRHLDGPKVAALLREASWPLISIALWFTIAGIAAQILRTQRILEPTKLIPLRRLAHYHLAAGAATNLLPARAGDALRAYLWRINEGIPIATTVGVAFSEYAVKAVTLFVLALPLPWLVSVEMPIPSTARIVVIAVVVVTVVAATVYAYRRARRPAAPPWLRDSVAALHALEWGRNLAAILAFTTAAWLCEAFAIVLVADALGNPIGFPGAILVLVTLNLALVVPSTPGRIGVFELGAGFGLTLLGVPESDAIAIALLCHLIQYIPTTLLGLAGLPLALAARRQLAATPQVPR